MNMYSMRWGFVFGVVAWLGLSVSALAGGSFGINFTGKDGHSLDAETDAGLSASPQSHWNNMTIDDADGRGFRNSGELDKLVDASGEELKKLEVTVQAQRGEAVFPQNGAPWGFKGGDKILHEGLVSPRPKVEISDIPYKKYDVIVYISAGENGGKGRGAIAAGGRGDVDETEYGYNFVWLNGDYVEATPVTDEPGKANYIRFRDNTARDAIVTLDGLGGGGWTGIAAIQVVETSE